MKRWFWRLAILTLVVGCVSNFALTPSELKSLPQSAGEWRLLEQAVLQPVPPEFRSFRSGAFVRKAWRGNYSGPHAMTVSIYKTSRPFDSLQQWRVTPGKMAFMRGGYFGVAESEGASVDELRRFVRSLDACLPPGSELLK